MITKTQSDNEFPAHEYLAKYGIDEVNGSNHTGDNLIQEFVQLKSAHEALLNCVVILPDDAEPEVGDLIYKFYPLEQGGGMNHWYVVGVDFTGDTQCSLEFAAKCVKENGFKFLRNSLPVIYKSKLKGGKVCQ